MKWIRIWTNETIHGTTFTELNCEERGIWFSLLVLAGEARPPGKIQLRPGIPYQMSHLAASINSTESILIDTVSKLVSFGKVLVSDTGIISISNWYKYQTSYEKVQTSIPIQVTDTGEIRREEIIKPPLPPRGLNDNFHLFWQAWPRKVNKAKAIRAWIQLDPKEELFGKIMAALKIQKKSPQWQKDNGQFIPHPSTWINGRRWEDELESEKKTW